MANPWWQNSKTLTALFSLTAAAGIILLGFIAVYVERNLEARIPPPVGLPERLIIPILSIDARIQSVGTDAKGRMGLPTNFTDVAWYKHGPKPGASGSAVIAGHLDTAVDDKAVFAKLSSLKKGDDIYVTDKTGEKIHFRVTKKEVYDDTKAPLEKIFDQKGISARLNLVTCDGVWDPKAKNYSQRLLIYSERVF